MAEPKAPPANPPRNFDQDEDFPVDYRVPPPEEDYPDMLGPHAALLVDSLNRDHQRREELKKEKVEECVEFLLERLKPYVVKNGNLDGNHVKKATRF